MARRARLLGYCCVLGGALACCPNQCGLTTTGYSHGTCTTADCKCKCDVGYQGGDCSEKICPLGKSWADQAAGVDDGHRLTECSDRGHCERVEGMCVCAEGFTGLACNRLLCPSNCNHQGECRDLRYHASQKNPGLGTVHKYDQPWDYDMIQGCHCDYGFFGYDCSLRHCPFGDDPLTGKGSDITLVGGGNPANEQFDEIQTIFCKANGGKFTIQFRGFVSEYFESTDSADLFNTRLARLPSVAQVSASYTDGVTTACSPEGNTITIEFTQDFGDIPLLVMDKSQLLCTDTCKGVTDTDDKSGVSVTLEETRKGTKENKYCSNRGLCDITTGVCTCQPDWDTSDGEGNEGKPAPLFNRGDCGYAKAEIVSCPGEIACSGHGVCKGKPTYACMCSEGWDGTDCSEMLCTSGKAWFDFPSSANTAHSVVECSNLGYCDRTKGACMCFDGFEGGACNRMTCPSDGDVPCSGHGKCMHMGKLAMHALDSRGDTAAFSYGMTPNDNLHWDREAQWGCICDTGYQGFDCTRRTCPYGDDPNTRWQEDEVQSLVCNAVTGRFTITFRQAISASIPYDATTMQVKAALEATATIRAVNVAFTDEKDKLCNVDGNNTAIVTFLKDYGDLPPLHPTPYEMGTGTVIVQIDGAGNYSVTGTKENEECSGRGLCDRNTGLCKCFLGHASSDGRGKPGDLRDCGHKLLRVEVGTAA